MSVHKSFIATLFALFWLIAPLYVSAQTTGAGVTLDQAVSKVQNDTGGKVLSAEQRQMGRRQEYRIKVLTPEGHVRVIVVPAESSANPHSNQSNKHSPGKRAGNQGEF